MYYQDKYLQLIVEVLSEAERIVMLKEAVPYPVVRKYLKIERDPTAEQRLTKIFNNLKAQPGSIQLDKKGDRIAFPYDVKGGPPLPIEKEINDYIEKHQFTVKDYIKGIAFDEKNQRDIKIGKVLTLVSKKEKEYSSKKKGEDLFSRFTKDPKRAQAKKASFLVVFTKDKYDIATMSADRTWESCMDILSVGRYTHYVKSDIKEGTFVAYIIESTDTNIQKPLGRISIKPYIKIDKDREISDSIESGDDVVNYAEEETYGNIPGGKDKFIDFVDDMMKKVQKISGRYDRSACLYPDSDRNWFMDKDAEDKTMSAALKYGKRLPEELFMKVPEESMENYIDKLINNNNYLEDYEFKKATDTQKIKYINIKLKKGNFLFNNEFKSATDEQKKKSIVIKLKKGEYLDYDEFQIATDEQKQKSIVIKLEKGDSLSYNEFQIATDEQKQKHVRITLDKSGNLTSEEFQIATDEQKKEYINTKLEKGEYLEVIEFRAATEEQKEKHVGMKLDKGDDLSYNEFMGSTEEQKKEYINTKLEKGDSLTNSEFMGATEEQKKEYINTKLEKGDSLQEYELEAATEKQKEKSIDIKIKNGHSMEFYEFSIATEKQKKDYIDIRLDKEYGLRDYELEAATEEQKEKAKLKGLYEEYNRELSNKI